MLGPGTSKELQRADNLLTLSDLLAQALYQKAPSAPTLSTVCIQYAEGKVRVGYMHNILGLPAARQQNISQSSIYGFQAKA